MKKTKAFTLSEVLLTLLIIGVIASLTIPNLIVNIQNQELKVAWKKGYQDINQSTLRLMSDNGGSLRGVFSSDIDIKDKYKLYLNYSKTCGPDSNCWHDANAWYALNNSSIAWGDGVSMVLNNGFLLSFGFSSSNCSTVSNLITNVCGIIRIDINGFKKPNTIGKDIFYIHILENGLKPWGVQGDAYSTTCSTSNSGYACAALYLYQ